MASTARGPTKPQEVRHDEPELRHRGARRSRSRVADAERRVQRRALREHRSGRRKVDGKSRGRRREAQGGGQLADQQRRRVAAAAAADDKRHGGATKMLEPRRRGRRGRAIHRRRPLGVRATVSDVRHDGVRAPQAAECRDCRARRAELAGRAIRALLDRLV